MCLLKKYLLIPALLIFNASYSFAGEDCLKIIGNKLENGKIVSLTTHFDDRVSLIIPGSHSSCSHAQASLIIKDFFTKNKPQSLVIEHAGNNEKVEFAIGKLKTDKGSYRVYVQYKKAGDDCIIKELRLEK